MNFPALFLPYLTVRHEPDLVCGMLRIRCATYSGFTVRHAPDYASRTGRQQTNRHFHVLATPLHLVNRTDPADQENRSHALTAGRRSTDRDHFELYDRWLSLSPRERHERQVTYLTCQGCKNAEIAFQMSISLGTVKSYLEHVYFKIDVRSKTELRLKFYNFDFNSSPP